MAQTRTRKKNTPDGDFDTFKEVVATELSPDLLDILDQRYMNRSKVPAVLLLLVVAVSALSLYLFTKVSNIEKTVAAGSNNVAGAQAPAPTRPASLAIAKPDSNQDHWRGETNARYVWVEYADFECPFCKQVHPNIVKIFDQYKDKLAWVYRHYPLPFHPKAQKTAEAAECAQDQGGQDMFWKMGDTIVDKMPDIELTDLPTIAASLGLNQATFKQCLDSGKFTQKVKDQLAEGNKAGVQATPSNVIYDTKTGKNLLVEGALPYDNLKQALDTFIKANN